MEEGGQSNWILLSPAGLSRGGPEQFNGLEFKFMRATSSAPDAGAGGGTRSVGDWWEEARPL